MTKKTPTKLEKPESDDEESTAPIENKDDTVIQAETTTPEPKEFKPRKKRTVYPPTEKQIAAQAKMHEGRIIYQQQQKTHFENKRNETEVKKDIIKGKLDKQLKETVIKKELKKIAKKVIEQGDESSDDEPPPPPKRSSSKREPQPRYEEPQKPKRYIVFH